MSISPQIHLSCKEEGRGPGDGRAIFDHAVASLTAFDPGRPDEVSVDRGTLHARGPPLTVRLRRKLACDGSNLAFFIDLHFWFFSFVP